MRKMVKTLSPTEQLIYSKLYPKRVVTIDDVVKLLKDRHKSADYITNLREKGFLQKIKKGVYAVIPPDMIERDYLPDKFLIAANLQKEYYISHHSALELHGIAESAFSTIYISVRKYSSPFSYKNLTFKFVTTKHFFGVKKIPYKQEKINVSDIEKTVLDCIRRIKYAGGLEELVKSLSGIPYIDYDKMWRYLLKFNETSLFHKTGFIFDYLKDVLSPPDNFIKRLKRKIGKKVYYLDGKKRCMYVKEWRIMVPKNLGEMRKVA